MSAADDRQNLDLPNILIVGASGAGKSTSMRALSPEKTIVINTERKRLPFRTRFPKQAMPKTWTDFKRTVEKAMASDAEVVVIDSLTAGFELALSEIVRAEQDDKRAAYGVLKDSITDFFAMCKVPDKVVVMTAIEEPMQDDSMRVIKTVGAPGWWGKGHVPSQFELCLFAQVHEGRHVLLTRSDGKHPAKAPMEMLPDVIDNDVNDIIARMLDYYDYAPYPYQPTDEGPLDNSDIEPAAVAA